MAFDRHVVLAETKHVLSVQTDCMHLHSLGTAVQVAGNKHLTWGFQASKLNSGPLETNDNLGSLRSHMVLVTMHSVDDSVGTDAAAVAAAVVVAAASAAASVLHCHGLCFGADAAATAAAVVVAAAAAAASAVRSSYVLHCLVSTLAKLAFDWV